MIDKRRNDLSQTVFLLDSLLTILTFLFAFYAKVYFEADKQTDLISHLFLVPLLLAFVTAFISYYGGYQSPHRTTLFSYAWSLCRAMVLTLGVVLAILFFMRIQNVSRLIIIIFAVSEFFALLGVRFFIIQYYRASIKKGRNLSRVLIIGSRDRAKELTKALRSRSMWGVEIIGYLDPDPSVVGGNVDGLPIIGCVENITECLKRNVIDEVIIAISRSLLSDVEPLVTACEEEGITLRFMADVFNVQVARISLSHTGNIPLLTLESVAQDEDQLFFKRLFDMTVTLLAMPFVLPIMAITAVCIKLDSRGPIFFVQQRVGLRKHIFPMFKFRSMQVDAEEKLEGMEHLNEAEGPIFKMTDDPRITRVGRFIRKASIDELPQLFNVLRGDMSLVGPRPMSIRDVDLFDKGIQRKRFSVKPGITCLWQISGRSNLPFHKWLELDLMYIENWSFALDLRILFKTLPAVIRTTGAK